MANHSVVCWLGMHIAAPESWEVVRHSPNVQAGSLVLVDRTQQRMQFAWTASDVKPDIGHIFQDFRSRDMAQLPKCTLSEMQRKKGWQFYRRTVDDKTITRAGRYDSKLRRWIDLVLPWPEGIEEEIEELVLGGYRTLGTTQDRLHWRVFNLDFEAPGGWELLRAEVFPANAVMTFEKGKNTATVARVGMPEAWFDGHLESFLRRRVGEAPGSFSFFADGKHERCRFEGKERRFHPRWLVGGRFRRQDLAWHCENNRAVFQVTTRFQKNAETTPGDFAVRCCSEGMRS